MRQVCVLSRTALCCAILFHLSTLQIWIARLADAKEIEFDQSIVSLIGDLYDILDEQEENEFVMTEAISLLGIDLAEAMSEETYIDVFASLGVLPGSPNSGLSCGHCISDLEDWTSGYGGGSESSNTPKCNCRWTCGQPGTVCTHSVCEETSRGCGFLWLGSCKERDEIFIGNCP